jgi:hypothetical protein
MIAMSNPYDQNPENPYNQNPNQGGMPPYGQNPYQGGYGVTPQPHPQGTTVLVLGIVGLVVCFIAGIIAVVMGNRALKEIDANPAAYSNRQSVVIGRVLGIISIVWQVLALVAYIIVIVVAIGSSGTS